MTRKPPLDPHRAAWWLLALLVVAVQIDWLSLLIGCAATGLPAFCAFTGVQIRETLAELITAIVVLINMPRKP